MGLDGADRVALVLPHGPEMATAVLGVAAGMTCAPLNPAYTRNEFDFCLTHLSVTALLVQAGMDSPARASASAGGIRVIELSPKLDAAAGLFTLTGKVHLRPTPQRFAQPDDVALVMHTSGTTSRPKIVPLTHTNICTAAHHVRTALALVERDRCLNVLPLFHLHGLIGMMLSSLAAGASIICPASFSASQFFAWMAEFRPTWYTAVPAIQQAILGQAALHHETIARYPLRFIRSASAPLPPRVQAELEQVFQTPVLESYGMTETASQITSNPLPPWPRKAGSVGVVAGPDVAIMDDKGRLLAAGEIGEVVVRGASVFQGYDNDPIANRNAFTHGWFRTGDQGFWDAEGYLFLTGRLKELINRGGEKIAPQEVDAVLMAHPAVAEAVTFAVPDARLGEEIAAAVVLHQNAVATARELREFAVLYLVDFKVPRQVFIVQDIPKGSLGKLQRFGLAEALGLRGPESAQPVRHAGFVPPRTPFEERLVGLWAEVLGLKRVGINDDFFQLGGNSLLAVQLMTRIREALHVDISLLPFFEKPTVAGIADTLETARWAEQELRDSPLHAVSRDGALPASVAQEQLWLLDQILPGMLLFNIPYVMRLMGPLNITALEQSCDEMIRRHEALRTTFAVVDGQVVQVIAPTLRVPCEIIDLCTLPTPERDSAAWHLVREAVRQPFDLARGPLWRLSLLRLDGQEHRLCLTMHHIISDGGSLDVFTDEFAVLYDAFCAGAPSPLPALPIQYADFAHWQRHWQHNAVMQAQLAYWKQQLHAPLPRLELPTDRLRTEDALSFLRTARQPLILPKALSEALKSLSHREGNTLFMTLLAAFKILLYGYTGQEDLCVGSLITNRHRRETERLIGLCVNTILLRTDLGGNPVCREVLQRVRATTLAAYLHQDLPFEELVRILERERSLKRASLCQVMLILQDTMYLPAQPTASSLHFLETDSSLIALESMPTTFDVVLMLRDGASGLTGSCIYQPHLFDTTTIQRMLANFQQVLERIIAQPEQPLSVFRSLVEEHNRRA
jgi:acyl-CoA synthetase (AMP-forming)/AMP-acid ligase II